jgi:aldose 1-epimerase
MEKNNISHFKSVHNAKLFGVMLGGNEVWEYKLSGRGGMEVCFINYGAAITSLKVPTADGKMTDVVLGFDTLENYIKSYALQGAPYIGAVVGRYAGRIKGGRFRLNDKDFQLSKNHGNNTLHGGVTGFGQVLWKAELQGSSIIFSYTSPDGDEGFPGELTVKVIYTVTDDNELLIEYKATTTKDTVLNLTQHSYFNLEGHSQTIKEQELFINSSKLLETNAENIPTGFILNVANCPFDFSRPKKCPYKIDTSFVLQETFLPQASLFSSTTGLLMSVFTNQPSVHIYVGGSCSGKLKGKDGADYHELSGICFETQNFPDAPNHAHFPNAELKKGEEYYKYTRFKFEQIKKQDL